MQSQLYKNVGKISTIENEHIQTFQGFGKIWYSLKFLEKSIKICHTLDFFKNADKNAYAYFWMTYQIFDVCIFFSTMSLM